MTCFKPSKFFFLVTFFCLPTLAFTQSVSIKQFKKKFSKNEIYLFAGMNFSLQEVKADAFSSPFNYHFEDIQKNIYLPGFFGGFRFDGLYNKKDRYSIAFSLNKLSTGVNLRSSHTVSPFVGNFSAVKPDEQFFVFNLAPHYKKLIALTDTSKYKIYAVIGPSIDWRLSDQSLENRVDKHYKSFMLKADVGVEFDNRSYYTIFLHYHHSLSSFTNQPVDVRLHSFEIGAMIKTKDIF